MAWVCFEIVKEEKQALCSQIKKSKIWKLVPDTPSAGIATGAYWLLNKIADNF
jgi:hypothetical protein